jgi:hypothetical protein
VDSLKVLDPEWPIREADVASDNAILWRAIAYSQGRRAGRHPKYGVWCVGQSAFVRGRSSATSVLVFAGLLQVAPSEFAYPRTSVRLLSLSI